MALWLIFKPRLYLDRAAFTLTQVRPTHFAHHAGITLKNVPNRDYTLRLFVSYKETELLTEDNRTWTPVQCLYVPYFPTTYNNR